MKEDAAVGAAGDDIKRERHEKQTKTKAVNVCEVFVKLLTTVDTRGRHFLGGWSLSQADIVSSFPVKSDASSHKTCTLMLLKYTAVVTFNLNNYRKVLRQVSRCDAEPEGGHTCWSKLLSEKYDMSSQTLHDCAVKSSTCDCKCL